MRLSLLLEKVDRIRVILEDFIRRHVSAVLDESEEMMRAREFNRSDSLAPLIATICDQEISADDAWKIPFYMSSWLREQGREFNASSIVEVGIKNVKRFLAGFMGDRWPRRMDVQKRLRWLDNVSFWIVDACRKIRDEYGNDPDNLFVVKGGRLSPPLIYFILKQFKGIGPKKASMVARDFAMGVWDWYIGLKERLKQRGIDLRVEYPEFSEMPIDVHVKRVFQRVGLVKEAEASSQDYQNVARLIYPKLPGAVDILIWCVGREYCKDSPKCGECPLNVVCDYSRTRLGLV